MSTTQRPIVARALDEDLGIKQKISMREDNYFIVWFLFGLLLVAVFVIPGIGYIIDVYKIKKLKRCKQLRKERIEREAEEAQQLAVSKDQRIVLPPSHRIAYHKRITTVNVPTAERKGAQQIHETRFSHKTASLGLKDQSCSIKPPIGDK